MPKRERPSLADFLKNFEEQKKKKESGDENKPHEQVGVRKEKLLKSFRNHNPYI